MASQKTNKELQNKGETPSKNKKISAIIRNQMIKFFQGALEALKKERDEADRPEENSRNRVIKKKKKYEEEEGFISFGSLQDRQEEASVEQQSSELEDFIIHENNSSSSENLQNIENSELSSKEFYSVNSLPLVGIDQLKIEDEAKDQYNYASSYENKANPGQRQEKIKEFKSQEEIQLKQSELKNGEAFEEMIMKSRQGNKQSEDQFPCSGYFGQACSLSMQMNAGSSKGDLSITDLEQLHHKIQGITSQGLYSFGDSSEDVTNFIRKDQNQNKKVEIP